MTQAFQELVHNSFQHATTKTIGRVKITPEMASIILERNTNNIPPAKGKIITYRTEMKKGNWVYNGDSIRFAKNGTLLDGQNRLKASIEADHTLEVDIVLGLDASVFKTIDAGRVRQRQHILAREFREELTASDAGSLSKAIAYIIRHERGISRFSTSCSSEKQVITANDVENFITDNLHILDQLRYVRERFGSRSIVPRSTVLYLYHLGSRFNEEYTKKFLDKLVLGIGLTENETLLFANSLLISVKAKSTRWSSAEVDNTIIKVWNSIGARGLHSITHKGNVKVRKDDPVHYMKAPTPAAIEEMLGQ